ncbi:ABC transporter ATP-binding protein/permease [Schaalia suimastitidis]|uniref:ABC transporter ATP-binding protein/permease n=1 Tax=Schaalia suimastitidis TaxID=121163 RepID=UPI000421CDB8|nr:ABC transporter ATP-binding protein [Schaalia suimastitidis]
MSMSTRIAIAFSWGTTIAIAATYLLIGNATDRILRGDNPTGIFLAACTAALISALCALAALLHATRRLTRHEGRLRHTLLSHIFALGVAQRTKERTGRLVNSMTDGVERNSAHTATFKDPMTASLLTPLVIVILIAAVIDWPSALLLAISIPLVPASVIAFNRAFKTVSNKYRAASRALAAQELDAIQGLSALVRMNAGGRMSRILADAAEDVRTKVMRYLAGNQIVLFVVDSVFSLGMITAALGLALWRMSTGAITPGQALSLLLLASLMLDPLDRIGQFFYIGMGGMAAGREIRTILAEKPTVTDRQGVHTPQSSHDAGTVRLQGVGFAWHDDTPLLRDINLHVTRGQSLVITGASGAGKSTLSALIQGHCRPHSGSVFIEGHDLGDVPLEWARSRISVVEQHTYLFTGTLADNLRIANHDATDEALHEAIAAAHLGDLLERLPQGLNTRLGQRGMALSGGEAQRVALARALLKDAPILLLDEPTAHVDLHSEKLILDTLHTLHGRYTTVIISHRDATIAHAHRRTTLTDGILL